MFCCDTHLPKGPCNSVRLLEFCLCAVILISQLGVGIDLSLKEEFCTVIFATSFAFTVITLIDIIVACSWYPIGWRAWIAFSVFASLAFFICAGLSFAIERNYCVPFISGHILIGIVFLIDAVCILRYVRDLGPSGIRPCVAPDAIRGARRRKRTEIFWGCIREYFTGNFKSGRNITNEGPSQSYASSSRSGLGNYQDLRWKNREDLIDKDNREESGRIKSKYNEADESESEKSADLRCDKKCVR